MRENDKTTGEFCIFDIPKDNTQGPIVMEQILSTIHGMNEQVSFEIWSTKGKTQFAFHTNQKNIRILAKLLESHYSGISIKEKKDNATKSAGKQISVSYLSLKSAPIFPIRRYSQTSDTIQSRWTNPYATILPSLNKLKSGEVKAIQIIIKSASESQRKKGLYVLSICHSLSSWWIIGKSLWVKKSFPKLLYSSWTLRTIFWLFLPNRKNFYATTIERIDHRNHSVESAYESAQSKLSQNAFQVCIRLIYAGKKKQPERLNEIASSFSQFSIPEMNGFVIKKSKRNQVLKKVKSRAMVLPNFLSIEELAGILHLPTVDVKVPELQITTFKPIETSENLNSGIVVGKTLTGNKTIRVPTKSLNRHAIILGKTGSGKSTLAFHILQGLINQGEGAAVIDPHGDLIENVLHIIPKNRIKDTVVFDPSDFDYPVAFNPLRGEGRKDLVVSILMDSLKKLFADSWGYRMEHILRHTIACLVLSSKTSIFNVPDFLLNEKYRKSLLKKIENPSMKSFWINEYQSMSKKYQREAVDPILNKIGRFKVPAMQNILGQHENTIDLKKIMDTRKILLVSLAKGVMGEENASLLGNLILAHIQMTALSRSNVAIDKRMPFYLFVDELQNFLIKSTHSIETILTEGRKYHIGLIGACQQISQLGNVVDTVFGNVGTVASFGVGLSDAKVISEYMQEIKHDDLLNLPLYHAYLRMTIDESPLVISMKNISPDAHFQKSYKAQIINHSRKKYARPRKEVEQEMNEANTPNTKPML